MNSKSKLLLGILFLTAVGFSAQADQTLQGTWNHETYLFVLNDTWQDVQGSWGHLEYNLGWDPVYREVKGKTAGTEMSVEFALDQHQIFSTVGCGWADFKYTSAAQPRLIGSVCTAPVDQVFTSESELLNWVKDRIYTELVMDFPEPTRAPIKAFFLGMANF